MVRASRRGVQERLKDIRAAAEDALAFAGGLDEAGFAALAQTDRRTYRALKNALSEIGEAVKLLPPDLLARHPGIDWRGWAGLRDMVSHQYFSLELPRLRPAVVDEMPALLAVVRAELGEAACEL
ncbi:DUF86 domain-containing protein [Roseomonas haemaphysalidis]|uniref:DUF86 domain-containing protein n=1 Tax=Roseomonas haemaphysalidis TaxID=2768162 RepID=A0ABS3KW07_9PROT|nr:HepT-like ribonuclease domain-containing protein [Roseomonas haemaphysalidis]MBO1081671.1 DUF86 domain-containing protein [Roseomonas haemaphysalidis]